MDDKWIDELRNTIENYKVDPPEGLWDDISKEIFEKDKQTILPFIVNDINDKKTVKIKWYYSRAAAILLALFTVGSIILIQLRTNWKKELLYSFDGDKKSKNSKQEKKTNNLLKENASFKSPFISSPLKTSRKEIYISGHKNNLASSQNFSTKTNLMEKPIILKDYSQEIISNNQANHLEIQQEINVFNDDKNTEPTFEENKVDTKNNRKKNHRWSANFLAGNFSSSPSQSGLASSSLNESIETPPNDSIPSNLPNNSDTPINIKRKIPITLGLSLQRNFNSHWSMSVGLSYIYQSTEFHTGNQQDYILKENKVQYISIPIQVNRNVIKKEKFSGYIHAGVDIRKALSNNDKIKYYTKGKLIETTREHLNSPTLVSVNAGLGAQLKITNNLGIYMEPVLEYHIKNETQRVDYNYNNSQNLNFNVRMGLRLLLK